jgi:hypothetical protein
MQQVRWRKKQETNDWGQFAMASARIVDVVWTNREGPAQWADAPGCDGALIQPNKYVGTPVGRGPFPARSS